MKLLLFINCLFLLQLLLLVYQDFKDREVTALLFFTLGITGGYLHYTSQYIELFLLSLLINFGALLIVILVLILYTKLIMKKKLKETIGVGDFLFFGVLAVSFPSISFLVLFSVSLLFSLSMFMLFKKKFKKKTVPLAGLQGLFLGLILLSNNLFDFVNLYTI